MGMDPLGQTDDFELTIGLKGPVKKKAFREFRKALDHFIDACEKISSGYQETGPPVKDVKLKVREVRSGVRSTA
jgi:hypothetical protein